MKSILKGKNSQLIIGLGVVVLILIGVVLWMYYGKKEGYHNLEEESELVNAELKKNLQDQRTPAPSRPPAKKPSLVLFHANSCPICVKFMPTWEQLKAQIAQAVDVMSFEYSVEPQVIEQAGGITGFPTIRFYPEGFPSAKFAPYNGNRQVDSLVRFAMSGGAQM